jgi:flagellar basal-body rod modification protein FlgD
VGLRVCIPSAQKKKSGLKRSSPTRKGSNVALQAIQATTPQAAASSVLSAKTVTQDDFLKLLIAQLQNQDPLNPMDNQEFAAQLATFNSLGQLIDINKKLGTLQNSQAVASQFNAASLIGKEVSSSGNAVSLQSGGTAKIGYQLGANAARVVVSIYNAGGEPVRQIEGGAQIAGEKTIAWDGKDNSGRNLASGPYNFEINAFDLNGKKVAATGRLQGTVTGVVLDGSEPVLELGELKVPLSRVTSVRSAR